MKLRNDFVTNSSSSSYIIAYKKLPELDDETIKKYPFLKNYSKLIEKALFTDGNDWVNDDWNDGSHSLTTRGNIFPTKEEWDKSFIYEYGWSDNSTLEEIFEDEPCTKNEYDKVISALNDGFYIIRKNVDYSDKYWTGMIKELAKNKENIIILRDE